MVRFRWAQSVVVLALILFPIISFAQTSKGIIAGLVKDNTGAVVVGAKVAAKNTLTGETRNVDSGPNGTYRIEAVEPGIYEISVSAGGFKTTTIRQVDVKGSIVTSVNADLAVGVVGDTIEVQASG